MMIWRLGGGSSGFSRERYPLGLKVCSGSAGVFLGMNGSVFFVASEGAADVLSLVELLRGKKDVLWEVT